VSCGGSSHWPKDHSQMLVVVWNVDQSFHCCAWQLLRSTAGSNAVRMICVDVLLIVNSVSNCTLTILHFTLELYNACCQLLDDVYCKAGVR